MATNDAVSREHALQSRINRLHPSKQHEKLLWRSGIGWAFDAMDVGLISFVIVALTAQWSLQPSEAGLIASIGFVGMAIGAGVGGMLADRFGRRTIFVISLLVYGIATGLSALVPGIALLLILRFIVGFGLGAELPVASTYVSEFAPARIRGRMIVFLEAFWALGWMAAAVIGYLIIPHSEFGWRIALAIGALPAVYAVVVRRTLPESPRWLAKQGKTAQAERVVAQYESSPRSTWPIFKTTSETVANDPNEANEKPGELATNVTIGALWAAQYRKRTFALWVVWLCVNFAYYGAFLWIPSMLVASGYSVVQSFGFTVVMTLAQLPGYIVAAWLIERWGRRLTLSLFLVGSALSALTFGLMTSEILIVISGLLLSFFNLGAWGVLYAVTPEMYPTAVRSSGAGWAAAVGRLASIIAPLIVPLVLVRWGMASVFMMFAAAFLIAVAASWALPEKRGSQLTD